MTPRTSRADGAVQPWPLFEVTVASYPGSVVAARSRGAALYDRFLDYREVTSGTFRDFLRLVKVRRVASLGRSDAYDYVRRNYDRDLTHGTRVTITGEGRDLEGRAGTVIHPGRPSTAYAHVVLDGDSHAIIVHPYSVVIVPDAEAGACSCGCGDDPFICIDNDGTDRSEARQRYGAR